MQPQGSAKYVAFQTLADRETMPGLRYGGLDWPYSEGLRLDEAMHPLTLLTLGMYGKTLPNQSGAPSVWSCLEVWFQEREVNCDHPLDREAAQNSLE